MNGSRSRASGRADDPSFLNPSCSPVTLDTFGARQAILAAVRAALPRFNGTVLDVGCGVMPYRSLLLAPPSRAVRYVGLDLRANEYCDRPDLFWDGQEMPMRDDVIDCALATEVLEHCPDPEGVIGEVRRVLRPGGLLFFTVPFLWPLHTVPHDQYRYTPFALERMLRSAGFGGIELVALGGWDASLAQMIGLWVRRRPMSGRKRALLSTIARVIVSFLMRRDDRPDVFDEGCMLTGIAGTAIKRP